MKKTALQKERERRGWTQKHVAEAVGTTIISISRWENGEMLPRPYFRARLAELFSKSEQELGLDGTVPPAEPDNGGFYDPAIPLPSATRLIGRETELAELKQRLYAGGSVALTALNGLPGVGKTTLVMTLAHDPDVRAHFHDGVLWAGLGPTPNLPGLLSRWSTLLGISSTEMASFTTSETWTLALRKAIGERHILIIIDDAWKIGDALACQVGGPSCTYLITTRFPGIAMHAAGTNATILHELGAKHSLELLTLFLPELELPAAQELIKRVGGLPLALTLIGNYLRLQAYSGQTRRVTQALERLTNAAFRLQISEPRGPVERHPSLPSNLAISLESVIAVTDQQLDESARQTLYALSVFPPKPNSFSEEAALAVTGLPVDALDALTDFGLVEGNGPGHYTMHQTIADYAHLHLKDQTVFRRLIAYSFNYMTRYEKNYEKLGQESGTLLAALEIAYEHDKQQALLQACLFAPYLLAQGQYQLAELHMRHARQIATELSDDDGLMKTLLYLGKVTGKQGHSSHTIGLLQEGLTLARKLNNKEWISAYLNDLGWIHWKSGKYNEAESCLQEGLALARTTGNLERAYQILNTLSAVVAHLGDYATSEVYALEGLTLARQHGDPEQITFLLINLGITLAELGRAKEAEQYFLEGLELARQIKHQEWLIVLLINLGQIILDQGNLIRSEDYYREALALAKEINGAEWIGVSSLNLSELALKRGDYAQAEALLDTSLKISNEINRPHLRCQALNILGNLHLIQQRYNAAATAFQALYETTPEGDQELFATAHYGLARVAQARGEREAALLHGKAALATTSKRNLQEIQEWSKSLESSI